MLSLQQLKELKVGDKVHVAVWSGRSESDLLYRNATVAKNSGGEFAVNYTSKRSYTFGLLESFVQPHLHVVQIGWVRKTK